MKTTLALLAALFVLTGCTEPDHAQSREPAQALQSFTPAQEGFLPDAPSYEVQEAIRSAAIEVRPDRALFLAGAMDAARAEEEEALRPGEMVAAHRAFPFNSRLRLTHRDTGNRVYVRIIDGGPFADAQVPTFEPDPAIPISPDAARLLGIRPGDRAHVWVEVVEW
jgi:hypothetical protein